MYSTGRPRIRSGWGRLAGAPRLKSLVGEALAALTTEFAALRSHLSNDKGQLRSFVNVYLNDDDIRRLDERDKTAVASSDTLSIVPSIAGGRQ
jgi:molybdopterin converting factor small subunit